MSQIITLHVPDSFFQPLLRVAQANQQPVEELLLTALRSSLPPLEDLPADIVENLTALESLDELSLRQVMLETTPADQAEQIHELLYEQQTRSLESNAQEELATLQRQADLLMLRKARAAVLLRFRGKPIPTITELRNLTEQMGQDLTWEPDRSHLTLYKHALLQAPHNPAQP